MKNILKYCVLASLVLNIILGTYVTKREPVCGRTHLDDIVWGRNVVEYGKTAKEIAEIYMDSRQDESFFRWIEGVQYDVLVSYDMEVKEWTVRFSPMISDGIILDSSRSVTIRGDYGIVTGYGW